MKKIELLAPAGDMDAFKAALYAGADAIYIAGKMFGARSYAGNFTESEMKEALDLAHLYHVKVYVTVNTIVYEAEVKAFLSYIDTLVQMHVDALIVQDLGMADLIHQIYPTLELHASTQMHIHNKEGVAVAQTLGFTRVVLARETPIHLIREIKKESSMQLEVFGHGALCVSYSGQCYMSYLIGGRSGNRGTCAQCCRQKYDIAFDETLQNTNSYLLSMKDLSTIEHIKEFIESGIDSLKIEGRMKRPEYVYLVVQIYRKAIDAYYSGTNYAITEKEQKELLKIFNRQFTKGFLFGEDVVDIVSDYRPNHRGIEIAKVIKQSGPYVDLLLQDSLSTGDGIRILNEKEDLGMTVTVMHHNKAKRKEAFRNDIVTIRVDGKVTKGDTVVKTSDIKQLQRIRTSLKEIRYVPISMFFVGRFGKKMQITLIDGDFCVRTESDHVLGKATSAFATKEEVVKRLGKLGNTIYTLESIEVQLEEGLFIPIKELNDLRRKAVDSLMKQVLQRKTVEKKLYTRKVPSFLQEKKYFAYIDKVSQYQKIKNSKFTKIYCGKDLFKQINDPRMVLRMPRVVDKYEEENVPTLITELGGLVLKSKVSTDFSFNVTNSYTVALLHSLGIQNVTISYECNDHQIQKIITAYQNRYHENPRLNVIVYGEEEAMLLKYNPLLKYHLEKGYLIDRFQNKYRLSNEGNYTVLYNNKKRNKKDQTYFDLGITSVSYDLRGE